MRSAWAGETGAKKAASRAKLIRAFFSWGCTRHCAVAWASEGTERAVSVRAMTQLIRITQVATY